MQLELIRFVASYKPLIASAKVSERIITIIKHLLLSQMPAQVWLQTLVFMITLSGVAHQKIYSL
jgi:hypothetical protein